ncbi:MAG: site-specific integrase, partial [Ekhidna sp.]|nr:site-specific integrase [Ekhidna sp.]
VLDFKEYLDKEAKSKSNKGLSQNSKYSYFNKLRAALKQAVKDGILPTNPSEGVDAFKQGEPEREFLTMEELQAAANTECEIPQLKTAFIFSCLTGLRWSDINKLVWSEVQHSKENGYYIRFRQKKTKGAETLPISEQAFGLLGDRTEPEDRVFVGLKYSAWHNLKLQQWMVKAGITKTITFHCARHTYATLQLSAGTDIYTVSKLLGHKELKTTQVYAKIIDEKKKEAANKIQLDL